MFFLFFVLPIFFTDVRVGGWNFFLKKIEELSCDIRSLTECDSDALINLLLRFSTDSGVEIDNPNHNFISPAIFFSQ